MKNFTLKNLIAGVALSAFMLSGSAVAQSALPTDAQPMIVIPHNQTVNYKERTLCMKVVANVPFEVTGGSLGFRCVRARTARSTFTWTKTPILSSVWLC